MVSEFVGNYFMVEVSIVMIGGKIVIDDDIESGFF